MDYAQRQRDPAKHLVGLTFVALLHVLIIYALVTGLARKVVDVIKKPIETKIVEEQKPPPPPETPPPPPPQLKTPPPPFIPPPEVQIAVPPPPTATITAVTTTPPPPVATISPTPPPVAHAPVRVAPVIDAAHNCQKPEYPAASRRAEETGTVTLRFFIDEQGNAIKSEVVRSSGHKRLDEAARSALSLCHFKPGTLDGKAVPMAGDIQYVWRLE
jgi:periplasmic protein TonB